MHVWIKNGLRWLSILAAAFTLLSSSEARAGDPTTVDCLSANEKAIALRADHKLRAARAQLLVCASANCPADVRKECSRRVEEVNAAIPTIVFGAKDPSGNDLTAVTVTVDGEVIAHKLEGTAVSLDPGAHAFTFEAAGQPTLTKQIVVRQGEKERREIIQLGTPSEPAAARPGAPADAAAPGQPMSGRRKAALVIGGVGVAGLAVGGVFGALSISKHGEAQKACPDAGCPTQAGLDAWNSARLDGTVSTIGFVAGGVLVASGVVLWITGSPARGPTRSGDRNPSSPEIGVGPGFLTLKEVW